MIDKEPCFQSREVTGACDVCEPPTPDALAECGLSVFTAKSIAQSAPLFRKPPLESSFCSRRTSGTAVVRPIMPPTVATIKLPAARNY